MEIRIFGENFPPGPGPGPKCSVPDATTRGGGSRPPPLKQFCSEPVPRKSISKSQIRSRPLAPSWRQAGRSGTRATSRAPAGSKLSRRARPALGNPENLFLRFPRADSPRLSPGNRHSPLRPLEPRSPRRRGRGRKDKDSGQVPPDAHAPGQDRAGTDPVRYGQRRRRAAQTRRRRTPDSDQLTSGPERAGELVCECRPPGHGSQGSLGAPAIEYPLSSLRRRAPHSLRRRLVTSQESPSRARR